MIKTHKILPIFITMIIVIAFFGNSCGLLGGENEQELKELITPEQELIPLEVGNYWVHTQWYLDPEYPDTVREEILNVQNIIADQTKIRAYGSYRFHYKERPREDALIWLRANGPVGFYQLGGRVPTDSLYNLDKGLYFKYPASVGEEWEHTTVSYQRKEEQYIFGSTRTVELIDTTKTVETPAGVFKNCYVYRHNDFKSYSPLTHFFFVKPGVGIVGVDTRGPPPDTILAGQKRLLEYKLN